MADFLFEIMSEEIPARMQLKAAQDLKKMMSSLLSEHELIFCDVETFVTPRRLGAIVKGLAPATQEKKEEKRGPRLTAPEKAIQGFLKAVGLLSIENCEQKEGYYYAYINTPAQKTVDVLPSIVRLLIHQFSWPKTMRWPQSSVPWVRPIRSVTTVYDGLPLYFPLDELGLATEGVSRGHRFLSPASFSISSAEHYKQELEKAYVVLDHHDRQNLIENQLQTLAKAKGCSLEKDQKLLEEVAGLVEYPVPNLGTIDSAYMSLPKAVLSTSMRVHQKYFTFVTESGEIAPFFGFVSNTLPEEGGALSLTGYERVLKARLEDAKFFYEQDLKVPLEKNILKLHNIIFHEKLGTVGQKSERLQTLVESQTAKRAAILCKADLVSSMVGEFPELQGIMGAIYAQIQGEPPQVAKAIQDHYHPQGEGKCPKESPSVEVALADKIDTLVGFFGIKETPTGSKDPYALRRAALGVIRLIRENSLQNLDLTVLITKSIKTFEEQGIIFEAASVHQTLSCFMLDRLENVLKAQEIPADYIKAVFASLPQGAGACPLNIWSLSKRTEILNEFLKSPQGVALQSAFRRANGILIQEKISLEENNLCKADFPIAQEQNLYEQLTACFQKSDQLLKEHNYTQLMDELSNLKEAVDDFFTLKINHEDPIIRARRLKLLAYLNCQIKPIADFTQLEGGKI